MDGHASPPAVRRREAHVWVTEVAGPGDTEAERAWLAVLSDAERQRMARFLRDHDRRLYLTAHALLRAALSWCAPGVDPAAWAFQTGPHGRPELAGAMAASGLRFNLSHTPGLVACLVIRDVDCGIDVEAVDRLDDLDALGRTVLAGSERAAVTSLPPDQRRAAFFRYWTLKEAYVKARGLGLTLPVDRCAFDLHAFGARLLDDPALDDDVAAWQFEQWWPTRQHVLALALRHNGGSPLQLVHHTGVPLIAS